MTRSYDSRKDTKKHIGNVRQLLRQFSRHLNIRAGEHDLSKLDSPELEIFNEFTPKLKGSTYGSEEYKGFLESMGEGLHHHYKENRHHPEHFKSGVDDMNLLDIVEMLCDWKAATLRHENGDINKSVIFNKDRFAMSDQLVKIFQNTIRDLLW